MESALLQEGTYTVLVGERKASGRGGPRRADTGELLWHELVMRHGGVEVGVITGGSAVAFRSAAEAVRCAIAVQAAQDAGSEWALGLQAGELPAAAAWRRDRSSRPRGWRSSQVPGRCWRPRWSGSWSAMSVICASERSVW